MKEEKRTKEEKRMKDVEWKVDRNPSLMRKREKQIGRKSKWKERGKK